MYISRCATTQTDPSYIKSNISKDIAPSFKKNKKCITAKALQSMSPKKSYVKAFHVLHVLGYTGTQTSHATSNIAKPLHNLSKKMEWYYCQVTAASSDFCKSETCVSTS